MSAKIYFICTPDNDIVKVRINYEKGIIKSFAKGSIEILRKYGWDIEKRTKKRK